MRAVRVVDLVGRVGREPDDRVGTQQLAGGAHRQVVLAHVDAVGAGRECQVGPVVDDQQRPGVVARRARHGGRGQQRVVAGVLVAQLHDVDAAAQCGAQHHVEVTPARGGVGDEVQTGVREAQNGKHERQVWQDGASRER